MSLGESKISRRGGVSGSREGGRMRASRSGEEAAAEASLERKGSRGFTGGTGRVAAERALMLLLLGEERVEEAIGTWTAKHRSDPMFPAELWRVLVTKTMIVFRAPGPTTQPPPTRPVVHANLTQLGPDATT